MKHFIGIRFSGYIPQHYVQRSENNITLQSCHWPDPLFNFAPNLLYLPQTLLTHLALDLDQHLILGVDLLLDGVVDVQQHIFALLAVL